MPYRPVTPLTVYADNVGVPLAGGELRFYETGTTTAKSVYSDEALSVNLGNEVELDSAGRSPYDIWVSGDVRVRLYDADGVLIDEADPVTEQGGAAASIPSQSGHSGKFLSTNGSTMSWAEVEQVPDPTGHSGKFLTNDGSGFSWTSLASLGLPETTNTAGTTNITIGPFLIQFGTDTFPVPSVSPPHGAVKAITFPEAFSSIKAAFVSANDNSVASHDYKPIVTCEYTNTTLTAQYNINENSSDASASISTTVAFSWMVIGIAA